MRIASNWPATAFANAVLNPDLTLSAAAGSPNRRRVQDGGQSGLRYSAMGARYARFDHRHLNPSSPHRLTNPSARNMIVLIRGSERRVAGFKSESRPASLRNRWPASYWNAWPASSESAHEDMLSAIERLAEVHARGVLTEAEFSAKKPELLGRI